MEEEENEEFQFTETIKKMPEKTFYIIMAIVFLSVILLVVAGMIIKNNQQASLQSKKECASVCQEMGRYRQSGDACTCIDKYGNMTNYFLFDGEFVMVG